MDNKKKNELLRKRNTDLNNKLKDLKSELDFIKNVNSESYKKAETLIIELEKIKMEWNDCLNNLKNTQKEYDSLLFYLKKIKNETSTPFHKKILHKRNK